MRRVLILVAVVAAALALAGCGGSGDSGDPRLPVQFSAAPSESAPAASTPSTPDETVAVATTTAAPKPKIYNGSDDEYFSFQTPSRNIVCAIYPSDPDVRKGSLRCDVATGTWTLPPEPSDCEFDWNRSMLLETRAQAGACVSDAVDTQGARTVAYNTGVRWHNITCVSQQNGLTCTNTDNDRGFTVSRASYTVR